MAASSDPSLVVIHNGDRRVFSVPSQKQLAQLAANGKTTAAGSAAFLRSIIESFNVSANHYQLQHYRSKARLQSDEQLRRVAAGAHDSGGETLVCNLVRKSGMSEGADRSGSVEDRLMERTGRGDGPRRIHIRRQERGGFGFTLRYFVVHPPANMQGERSDAMDTIFVKQLVSGGPGELAGLQVGDRLERVNGVSVAEKTYQDVIDMIKSSGSELTLLVTPSEDDHIQTAFKTDAYGKDGENTVHSSRTLAQTQDFNSGTSLADYASPLGAEQPFLRSAIRNNKISPSLNQHRRVRGPGSGSSSSLTQAQDLLQNLQQQRHGDSRSGSRTSLDESQPSPASRKNASTSSMPGYEPSATRRSSESLDDGRRPHNGGMGHKKNKIENGYSPSTGHHHAYRQNSAEHTDTVDSSAYLPGSSSSMYSGGNQAVTSRSEGKLHERDRSSQQTGTVRSADIPAFLKGPRQAQARELRPSSDEKSRSMENLGQADDAWQKSSSLPQTAAVATRVSSDRSATGVEERRHPVAQSRSMGDFHLGAARRLGSGGDASSPSPPIHYSASQEEEDWRRKLDISADNPVTTITATYAVKARQQRRGGGGENRVQVGPTATNPPWVRSRTTLSGLGAPSSGTPPSQHQRSLSSTQAPLDVDRHLLQSAQAAKANSLPRSSTPPTTKQGWTKSEEGKAKTSMLSKSMPHKLGMPLDESEDDDDEDEEEIELEDGIASPRSRLSLSAPSSPVNTRKRKLRPKSDVDDDGDEGKDQRNDRRSSWFRLNRSRSKSRERSRREDPTDLKCTAAAYLSKKQVLLPGGKKSHDRSWRTVYTILHGANITFYKEEMGVSATQGSIDIADQSIDIRGCMVDIAHDYRKRQNVFRIRTVDKAEYLLQAKDFETSVKWIKHIRSAGPSPGSEVVDGSELSNQPLILKQIALRTSSTDRPDSGDDEGPIKLTLAQRLAPSPGTRRRAKKEELGKIRFLFKRKNSLASDDRTFGVPLGFCPRSSRLRYIPLIIEKCLQAVEARGMDVVGIYRVPGTKAAVDNLVKDMDLRLSEMDLNDGNKLDISVISSTVKQYFRQLPDSLLTFEGYHSMVRACRITDPEERLNQLQQLVGNLPAVNFNTLHYLIRHLRRISANSGENKMEIKNLAIVFGPTLVRAANDDTHLMVTDMGEQCRIVEALLSNVDVFFPPDGEFDHHPTLAGSPPPEIILDDSSPQSMEPEADRATSASPPSVESKPSTGGKEETNRATSPSVPHAPFFVARPQLPKQDAAQSMDDPVDVSPTQATPRHISAAEAAEINMAIRPRDVYNVDAEQPTEESVVLEKTAAAKSRDKSRTQVAQMKQEVVNRWVSLHQWDYDKRHGEDSGSDSAQEPNEWNPSPEPLDPDQEAQAAKVMQRGIRRGSLRQPSMDNDLGAEQGEIQQVVPNEDLPVDQIRRTASDSNRRRPRNMAEASAAHRVSYYRAVNEGAMNIPRSKQQVDGGQAAAARQSFPESPLDYMDPALPQGDHEHPLVEAQQKQMYQQQHQHQQQHQQHH
eukprot:scpid13209/ scgid15155/ Rho GTPase-activating protein 21-B; Rho-type GTPase-activating protein 21-B; XrGAP